MSVAPDAVVLAEQSVLGALLLDNAVRAKLNGLAVEHFGTEAHRAIYQAIIDALDDQGACDSAILLERLRRSGNAERAGGFEYVNALAQNTPSAARITHYAEAVQRAARDRRAGQLIADAAAAAERGDIQSATRLAAKVAEHVEHDADAPRLLDLAALAATEPRAPAFVIDDLMPQGEVTLFSGHGGSGKSTIAVILAICVALGRAFFGVPTQRRRVAFFSFEDAEPVLHWRLTHICAMLGVDLSELAGWLTVIDCTAHGSPWFTETREGFGTTAAYQWARERMRVVGAQVAVVDNASDVFAANENDRAMVRAFMRALRVLVPSDGAALLLAHVDKITAKSPEDALGFSGSTAWHNSARSRLFLRPEKGNADRLILEVMKANHAASGAQIAVRWNDAAHTFVSDGEPVRSPLDAKLRDFDESEVVLGVIRAANAAGDPLPTATRGERSAHAVAEARGLPEALRGKRGRARFYQHVEALRAAGKVRVDAVKTPCRHLREVFRPAAEATAHAEATTRFAEATDHFAEGTAHG